MARIIIVDDDPDVLETPETMLAPEHDVTVTTAPGRALDLIREDASVELLVTDIRMPTQNGFMLIQEALHVPQAATALDVGARDAGLAAAGPDHPDRKACYPAEQAVRLTPPLPPVATRSCAGRR